MSKRFNPIAIFSGGGQEKPKPVAAPAPAPAPAAKPAAPAGPTAEEKAAAEAAEEDKKKKAAAAASGTILTGSLGLPSDETATGKKTLLGT